MTWNEIPTILDETTTDVLDRAGVDHAALARLNLDTISVDDLADWLAAHGTVHLSAMERIELAERLTRRRFLIGAGSLGLGVITGCGPQDEAVAPTATSVSTGYPRTVEHAGGSTTIEAKPTRVYVARMNFEMDALLALGVIPTMYGTVPGRELSSWQTSVGAAEATTLDITGGQPNIEALVAAGIDLVLFTEFLLNVASEEIEAYREVAPVVGIPLGLDFAEQLRIVAECLDLPTTHVQREVAQIEGTFDGFTVTPPSSLALITSADQIGHILQTPESPSSALLERLGLPAPSIPDDVPDLGGYAPISEELLPEIDAAVLLGVSSAETASAFAELEASPIFQRIPAVQAGRYQRLNADVSVALGAPTILSTPIAVEGLQRAFDALSD